MLSRTIAGAAISMLTQDRNGVARIAITASASTRMPNIAKAARPALESSMNG